jgi:tetratricopeptide (TPR) repeat protein
MSGNIGELYERGSELFGKGKYAEAEGLLREVIKQNPGYADVLNKLGVMANLDGRLKEASAYFEKALELNPRYTEAMLNLTITYNEMGKVELAGELLESSAKNVSPRDGLDPFVAGKLANEHFKLGNIYTDFGLADEAIVEYRKALKLRSGFPDVHTRLGIVLRDKQLFDEAISEFTRAKEINPSYGPAYVHLGLTYYMKGLTGLAFEEWEEALRNIPGLREARSLLNALKSGE